MTLKEICGDELYGQVEAKINEHNKNEADQAKKVKFVDLGEGGYVSKDKHTTTETTLATVRGELETLKTTHATTETTLKNTQTELETLKSTHATEKATSDEKVKNKIIDISINNAISSLGVTDDIVSAGLRSTIDRSKITIDDNFNISGLDDQVTALKDSHKDLFNSSIVKINTGSENNGGSSRKTYTKQELERLEVKDWLNHREDILASLNTVFK
jgi:hypothetical protein